MRRLTIAVDCDEVLVHSTEHMIAEYNRRYGTNVRLVDAHTSDIPEWEADRDEVHRRFDAIQTSPEYGDIVPPKETIDVIRRLAGNHELHVVTARPETVMDSTRSMIDKYFPGCFSSVRHLGQDGDKGAACQVLSADMLVDDSLKHLVRAMECGVQHRVWFGDYVWQPKAVEPEVVTVRCKNWIEVEKIVAKIAAK